MAILLLAAGLGFAATAAAWLFLRPLLRSRDLRLQVPAIAGAAVVCAVATSQVTAYDAADLVWRVVLGAGTAALAAYAPPVVLALALAPLAVAAEPSWGLAAAGAAGSAASSFAVGRRSRPLGALAGAVAAATSVHLERPNGLLAAAVGATAVAVIAIAGIVRMSKRRRRQVLRRLPIVAVPLFVIVGLGAASAASARSALDRGVAQAKDGLAATRAGDTQMGEAELRQAAWAFTSGSATLDAWWARPARVLPVVGVNLDVAARLASSGANLADVGASALDEAATDDIRLTNGTVPLNRIVALREPARRSKQALDATAKELSSTRRPWLAPPLAEGLLDLEQRVADASRDADLAVQVADVLPPMLGEGGPRRYFLAVVTPSEARGSGGIIGNYGEIVADGGKLTLARLGRITEELNAINQGQRTLSEPPEYLDRYARFNPQLFWQNATLSPDFPTVGRVIAELYPQSGGQPIDGVISVDPIFLARLLELIGPVEVPNLDVPLTAQNAEEQLLFEQYLRFDNPDRIDFLGEVSRIIWDRFTSRDLPGPKVLAESLGPAVESRHLQITSLHEEEQRLLDRLDLSGRVEPVEGDFLGVVTQNASGNKIDWFLDRSYTYDVTIDEDGRLEAKLHLELTNRAPASGLPPYVIGPFSGIEIEAGVNRMMLSIFSPWGLHRGTINGQPLLVESGREQGRSVYSTFVDIPAGTTAVIDVDLAGLYPDDRYRLDVLRQPMVRPDDVRSSVDDER